MARIRVHRITADARSPTLWAWGARALGLVYSPLIRFMRLTIRRSGVDSGVLVCVCLYFIEYKCTTDTHSAACAPHAGGKIHVSTCRYSVHGSVCLWWIWVRDVGAQCLRIRLHNALHVLNGMEGRVCSIRESFISCDGSDESWVMANWGLFQFEEWSEVGRLMLSSRVNGTYGLLVGIIRCKRLQKCFRKCMFIWEFILRVGIPLVNIQRLWLC